MKNLTRYLCLFAASLYCILPVHSIHAQTAASAELPDAPGIPLAGAEAGAPAGSAAAQAPAAEAGAEETHLTFIPNFEPLSASRHLPPQSVKEKFMAATETNVDFLSIVMPALTAAYRLGVNATPEFGKGASGYGRYYWHSWVDRTSEDYCVQFIFPAITHEDSRYYTLGRDGGSGWKRTGYALSRAVITRSDSGRETFNVSEIAGAGMASGLANLYYPSSERTFTDVGQRWGTNIGVDAGAFLFEEFWPDINRVLFHGHMGDTHATP